MSGIATLRREAEMGEAEAQFRYARALLVRPAHTGVVNEAIGWLKAASAQGFPMAMLQQAALSCLGWGMPQSCEAAVAFLEKAAATGDSSAVGQLNVLGGPGKVNIRAWFEPAATQRHCNEPRIFTVRNFIPKAACAWIIERSAGRLQPAPVKDPTRGGPGIHEARTNTGTSFSTIECDLVVQLVNLRIAAAVGLPVTHQERTNILHYDIGQQYRPHYDFIMAEEEYGFESELAAMGQRVATLLVYLNDGYDGGETHFPRLSNGWSYKGNAGDALVFWNLSETGARERDSLHAGLPVTKGEKWLLSKWIRQRPVPLV